MYSPPPPPRNLRWLSLRSLGMLERLLVGVLICTLAVGLLALFALILHLLGFPLHVKYPIAKARGFYRPVSLWATSWPRNKMVLAELWSRSSSAPHSHECHRSLKSLGTN
jgi:hypothetical protein